MVHEPASPRHCRLVSLGDRGGDANPDTGHEDGADAAYAGAADLAERVDRPGASRYPGHRRANLQQVIQDRKELELAESYNAIPVDPKRHAMLQEVVDAAQQVDAFPCSAKNRHRLAEAVAVMGNFNRDQVGKPETATMMVNGHPVAAGDPLAGQANDILWAALSAGVVGRTPTGYMTVPDPYAPVDTADRAIGRGAKFFCDKPN